MKGQGNQGMFSPSFGQPSSYDYFPNNGDFNTWSTTQQLNSSVSSSTAVQSRNKGPQYDDYYGREHGSSFPTGQDGIKSVEHGMQGLGIEMGGASTMQQQLQQNQQHQQHYHQQQKDRDFSSNGNPSSATTTTNSTKDTIATSISTTAVPKKMTWATVASQPAKPQIRTNSSSSILKKKGPGMPPPPMVPGKHNMDISTWDSPSKNGPILVPAPPPPVIVAPPIIEPSPLSQSIKPNSNNLSVQMQNQQHQQHSQSQQPKPQQPHHQQQQNIAVGHGIASQHQTSIHPGHQQQQQQQQIMNSGNTGGGPLPNMRPAWTPPNNRQQIHHPAMMGPMQQQQPQPSHQRPTQLSGQSGNSLNYHGPSQQQQHHQPQQQVGGHATSQQQQQHQQMQQSHPNHAKMSSLIGGGSSIGIASDISDGSSTTITGNTTGTSGEVGSATIDHPILEELQDKNEYNPQNFDFDCTVNAKFFVIKSYSEDDIHRSIKYEIWCSTDHGNKRLDKAFREQEKEGGMIFLLFSVNGSGHFCGVAQMMTAVDYNSVSSVWSQDKWKGTFKVKWIYVKDVPNIQLRHIRLENNENKSVTHSRDTQEVPNSQGIQVLRIISTFKHTTSIFDDFVHYEKRQEEEDTKKTDSSSFHSGISGGGYDKNVDKYGAVYDRGGNKGFSGQYNHGGGGRGGYDNRRNDDYTRGGGMNSGRYDQRGGGGYDGGYIRDDFGRSGGNRGDFRGNDLRKDDRSGCNNSGYMNRDRDNMDNGGYMRDNRNLIGRSDLNRDRMDHHGRNGRGGARSGGNNSTAGGSSSGGYRN